MGNGVRSSKKSGDGTDNSKSNDKSNSGDDDRKGEKDNTGTTTKCRAATTL